MTLFSTGITRGPGDRGISASYDPRVKSAAMNLLLISESYSQRKHTIRTLPGWNPTRTQSKDWFLSSHSEVSVALATGTTLVGTEIVDDLWFERWIADFAERLLAGRDLRSIESALRGLPPLSRALASRGQFEELRLWLTSTTFAAMASVSEYTREQGAIDVSSEAGQAWVTSVTRAALCAPRRDKCTQSRRPCPLGVAQCLPRVHGLLRTHAPVDTGRGRARC